MRNETALQTILWLYSICVTQWQYCLFWDYLYDMGRISSIKELTIYVLFLQEYEAKLAEFKTLQQQKKVCKHRTPYPPPLLHGVAMHITHYDYSASKSYKSRLEIPIVWKISGRGEGTHAPLWNSAYM